MEQRLNATYLRCGPFEQAAAVALAAAGAGVGIFLAAWGISFFWSYPRPEIAVRIANPEVHLVQPAPLAVKQDKPFELARPDPFVLRVEQPPAFLGNDSFKLPTASGDVITREVTVFSHVQHNPGTVVTGW